MTRHNQNYSQELKKDNKNIFKRCFRSSLLICVFVLFFSSLVLYLFQVNSLAAKGYDLRSLEEKKQQLRDDNEKLSLQAVELTSMGNLKKKLPTLKMEVIDQITYFDATGQVVARR